MSENPPKLFVGNVKATASLLWREKLEPDGMQGGEFKIGCCASFTVLCECEVPGECNWCCGTGWLTKRCKEAKDLGEYLDKLRTEWEKQEGKIRDGG